MQATQWFYMKNGTCVTNLILLESSPVLLCNGRCNGR